jgi:iron(III) transport system ATP-binding protein
LSIRGVAKSYGVTPVLCGIDLDVPAGSITALLGSSGCGKTTLLRILGGFADPDSGTVAMGGRIVCGTGMSVAPQMRNIGYVPQEGALFPHLNVAANIAFGLPRAARRAAEQIDELLELVDLSPALKKRFPHELSGGQQQRVAVARALARRPGLVLLDEPFSSLDTGLREETARAVITALRATAATVVLVTHDQNEALALSDQVGVIREGRLVQIGTPLEIYKSPVDPGVAKFVGSAMLLPAEVEGATARCALGEISVSNGAVQSSAHVLIRPEQLDIQPGLSCGQGAPARIADVSFQGHDLLVHLDLLPAGPRVLARVLGNEALPIGHQVTVTVRGPVKVFPGTVLDPSTIGNP